MGLLGKIGEKIGTMMTNHGVNNVKKIVNKRSDSASALDLMVRKMKQNNAIRASINPLVSDFPDDDLNVGRRIVHANVTEDDEIVVKVQMKDGSVGEITIKASTIAQIILDRNNRKTKEQEVGQTISIDVGDGDLGGSNPGERSAINYADADELLAASKKRLPSGVTGGVAGGPRNLFP